MAEMKSMAPFQNWPTRAYYELDACAFLRARGQIRKISLESTNGNSPPESQIQSPLKPHRKSNVNAAGYGPCK